MKKRSWWRWLFPFISRSKQMPSRRGSAPATRPFLISSEKQWNLRSLFIKNQGENLLAPIEEMLLTADVSIGVTKGILQHLSQLKKEPGAFTESVVKDYLASLLLSSELALDENNLNILFIFGVNGVGKTTSIAKLGCFFKDIGKSCALVAADTYRAAASPQLKHWGTHLDIPVIMHEGKSKPSAVLYDALESALARKYDVLLVDTAGRLHNREDLLEELAKLSRIIKTKTPHAKVQNLLVLDSTMGQSALEQAREFHRYVPLSGVILSKWDSSGKGGVVFSLAGEMNLPVYFVGTGEKPQDLLPFDTEDFIAHLFRSN